MNKEDKKKKMEELDQLFSDAVSSPNIQNPTEIMATLEDLPDLPEMELYDYDKDLEDSNKEGKEVINSMADLYLNNNEEVLANPYIKKKIEDDAYNHAELLFLRKMARKALIIQMKQMDMGDVSPRNLETFYNGLREIREINKQSTSTKNVMEKFYKTLKEDLGMEEKPNVITQNTSTNDEKDKNIIDQKNLNAKLGDILKNMKKKDE